MSIFFKSALALSALAGLSLVAAHPASAQVTVNFGAAQTISGDTDISNLGTSVLADAFANGVTGSSTTTVNGVDFTNDVQFSNTANGVSLATAGFTNAYDGFAVGFTPFGSLSAQYQDVLRGAVFNNDASAATFTLTGLTSGNNYLAQFFVADPRGSTNRTDTLSGGTTLLYNVNNGTQSGDPTHGQGGDGQFANATFTADASGTAFFTVTGSNGATQVNAFQLRQLAPAAVPEASTTVSFGLLLMLGLGGLAVAAKRKKSAA